MRATISATEVARVAEGRAQDATASFGGGCPRGWYPELWRTPYSHFPGLRSLSFVTDSLFAVRDHILSSGIYAFELFSNIEDAAEWIRAQDWKEGETPCSIIMSESGVCDASRTYLRSGTTILLAHDPLNP